MSVDTATSKQVAQTVDADRRRWARIPADLLPDVAVELASGAKAWLVDVSMGGARFRTRARMLPGLSVTLRFTTPSGASMVRCQIVRSALVNLSDGPPGYEVGVAFDHELSGAVADATVRAEQTLQSRAADVADPKPSPAPGRLDPPA